MMKLLTGSVATRHSPPVKVSSWVTEIVLRGMSLAKRAVSAWR